MILAAIETALMLAWALKLYRGRATWDEIAERQARKESEWN